MLSILFTLEYKCTTKFDIIGLKGIVGGECPDNVGCAKIPDDIINEIVNQTVTYLPDGFKISGKMAKCVVGRTQEDCDMFC